MCIEPGQVAILKSTRQPPGVWTQGIWWVSWSMSLRDEIGEYHLHLPDSLTPWGVGDDHLARRAGHVGDQQRVLGERL